MYLGEVIDYENGFTVKVQRFASFDTSERLVVLGDWIEGGRMVTFVWSPCGWSQRRRLSIEASRDDGAAAFRQHRDQAISDAA